MPAAIQLPAPTKPLPITGALIPQRPIPVAPAKKYVAQSIEMDLGLSDQERVSAKTAMLYGDSGLGKSSQLFEAAKWLYERTQKPIRLITAEDSSKGIFEPLIAVGVVQMVAITKATNPTASLRKLSRGLWPKDGEWLPYVPGSISGYLIEGATSIAESIQEDNREKGRFLGEQKDNMSVEQGETLALPGQFSYNFTQLEVLRLMKGFAMLDGLERVIWTAHENVGVGDAGEQLRGPGLVGKAKTGSVQKYVGLLLHLDGYSDVTGSDGNKVVNLKRRIWYEKHPDPKMSMVFYPAKITIPTAVRGEWDAKYPGGYLDTILKDGVLTPSLATLLQLEADLQEKSKNSLAAWKANLDGGKKE